MSGQALDPTVAFCDSAHGVEAPKDLATLETASVYEDVSFLPFLLLHRRSCFMHLLKLFPI